MQADFPKHLGSLKICAAGKGFHQYLQKSNCTGATLLISARRCQQREASWRPQRNHDERKKTTKDTKGTKLKMRSEPKFKLRFQYVIAFVHFVRFMVSYPE
jgi:hypothetical protein